MTITSQTSAAYIKPTTDPVEVGIGARPIGMGKAFVALADDANAVYINPAGLAGLKTWQVMSMTTKLINEINYVSLAGTYNTEYGTFGLGYVGANLGGSFVTGMTLVEDRGIIFPITEQGSINYTSSVTLLSYGSEAKRFLDYDFLENISVGATLKMFSQGLTGGGISEGTMNGYDMDVGMLYKPMPWQSYGISVIDALPASMGGKLTDSAGNTENLPAIVKLGAAIKVMGSDGLFESPQPLMYVLECDYVPTKNNYPVLVRTGTEWWPSSYLALRFGLDQDIVGTGTSVGYSIDTNMTAGVGIYYGGFSFDYAYHKYGSITDNDTTYLSLSYSAPVEIVAVAVPVEKTYLKINSPQDKLITYDEAAIISGIVPDLNDVDSITINGTALQLSANGTFEVTYPLIIGKNIFNVVATGKNGNILAESRIRVLRLVVFKDIQEGYWAKSPVEYLATIGIIGGYPDGTFRPDKTINRAELTTLLVRAKSTASPEAIDTIFVDVKKKHWASFFIKTGVETGLVTGYPDKTFRPAKSLSRAEGVTILSRFAELKEPDLLLEGPFPDVPGRHWAAKSITAARSAGLLVYLMDKPFEPAKEMTRAEAAEILSKTPFASLKVNNLIDFDSY